MTRTSKKEERRNRSPRKPKIGGVKTGAKKDNLPRGFKEHENAIKNPESEISFIPKIR